MIPDRGTALVTGAGRGIGAAIAHELLGAGFKVAMASIEQISAAAEKLDDGNRCVYYPFDVADIACHAVLVDRVERELGPLTCLVNNAGVTSLARGDMLELSPESFDRCVAINLRGTFFLTQAVAKRWIAAGASKTYRSVVTIGSVNAEMIGDSRADYCITKSALPMLTQLF